ncbi:unnamed protein product [Brassica oleracea]
MYLNAIIAFKQVTLNVVVICYKCFTNERPVDFMI